MKDLARTQSVSITLAIVTTWWGAACSDGTDPGWLPSSAAVDGGGTAASNGDSGSSPGSENAAPPADAGETALDGSSTRSDAGTLPAEAGDSCTTALHYAAGWKGDSVGLALGFNLADVSSSDEVNALPAGVKALVWLGMCGGADTNFVSAVNAFKGNSRVYGFYLMDEPDPTGKYSTLCPAENLKAESDYIHGNLPGTKTFIVLMDMGSDKPTFQGTYNPANTGIDLFGIDPYPCLQALSGCKYSLITDTVQAALDWGIPKEQVVPAYQAFGGGGYSQWLLPSASEEQQIMATTDPLLPNPGFDYAYAWGSQNGDTALSQATDLQPVFKAHNAAQCSQGDR